MIHCPVCHHTEYDGALYCSECGASLHQASVATQNFSANADPRSSTDAALIHDAASSDTQIAIFLVESGQRISLDRIGEWTLGRVTDGQAIVPDVDLTPYQAYEQGVSRLHATIRIDDKNRVSIIDMGSSNGTRVNGTKILSNTPRPLQHGDMVALGKLVFQIWIQHSNR